MENISQFIAKFIKCDEEECSSLPPEMPLPILFDVLAAAATIRCLVFHILHRMINRCEKLEFSRLENPNKRYIRNPARVEKPGNLVYAPVPKPPRVRYQQGEMGPVSASEENIATRALWEIFLVWELRSGVGDTRWTPEERGRLSRVPFEKINPLDLYESIRCDKVDLEPIEEGDFKDLMSKILEKDPNKRIQMGELRVGGVFTSRWIDSFMIQSCYVKIQTCLKKSFMDQIDRLDHKLLSLILKVLMILFHCTV